MNIQLKEFIQTEYRNRRTTVDDSYLDSCYTLRSTMLTFGRVLRLLLLFTLVSVFVGQGMFTFGNRETRQKTRGFTCFLGSSLTHRRKSLYQNRRDAETENAQSRSALSVKSNVPKKGKSASASGPPKSAIKSHQKRQKPSDALTDKGHSSVKTVKSRRKAAEKQKRPVQKQTNKKAKSEVAKGRATAAKRRVTRARHSIIRSAKRRDISAKNHSKKSVH